MRMEAGAAHDKECGRRTTFRGLLQGESLLYYGHMLATQMQQFTSDPPHVNKVFLRGAGDFISVSTNTEDEDQSIQSSERLLLY